MECSGIVLTITARKIKLNNFGAEQQIGVMNIIVY